MIVPVRSVQGYTTNNIHCMGNTWHLPAFTASAAAHGLFAYLGIDAEMTNWRVETVASGGDGGVKDDPVTFKGIEPLVTEIDNDLLTGMVGRW